MRLDEGRSVDDQLWRLFIAIQLPATVKSALSAMGNSVWRPRRGRFDRSGRGQEVRWTRRDNLHITLKFLGDTHVDRLDDLREAMSEVTRESAVFTLALDANGCFPGPRTPRVLWTGLRGDVRRMTGLESQLQGALALRDIERDDRHFTPHITVGRVRSGLPNHVLSSIGRRWTNAKIDAPDTSIPVDRIILVRSHLVQGQPPRYERVFIAKIA